MGGYTDLLYAQPSLLEGVARLFDISGALNEYNFAVSGEDADFLAIRSGWYAIGRDMRVVIDRLGGQAKSGRP